MRVAMMSDVHLDGPEDAVQKLFLRFLERLEADELWLLGDVFHRFWTVADRPAPPYEEVFELLTKRIDGGLTVRWVPGNHDFALSTTLANRVGLVVSSTVQQQVGKLRVHAEHGDLCDTGWAYGLTSLVLRGPLFALWSQLIGFKRTWNLLGRLAGAAHYEGPITEGAVVRAQHARASKLLARGADLVVMGHTHVPVNTVGDAGRFVNLGAFDHARHILIVSDTGAHRFFVADDGAIRADDWADD